MVVEPTLSGIHDMERALDLLNHFKIPAVVCVNKYDINEENTAKIVNFCESNGVEVVGKIPFDSIATEAMIAGQPILEYSPKCAVSEKITDTWRQIQKNINT
jgi:MinD superfamily P-loop ATPase